MDGGMGSPTNAALGEGYDLVVIADPLARMMGRFGSLPGEKTMLLKQGSRVVSFEFDDATAALIPMNMMDASKRAHVAELSRAQGREAVTLAHDNPSSGARDFLALL